MRARALSDALPDFGAVAPLLSKPARLQPVVHDDRGATASDAVWQERIAKAAAEAEARTTETLDTKHSAEMEKLATRHRSELDAASVDFASAMGADIARNMAALEDRIAELTAAAAARLLTGVLTDDLQKRSVERMATVVREALRDGEAVRIVVKGPASLYEPLRKAMGSHGERLRFVEAEKPDLSVSIDETVYETRLAEWSDALSQVVR